MLLFCMYSASDKQADTHGVERARLIEVGVNLFGDVCIKNAVKTPLV